MAVGVAGPVVRTGCGALRGRAREHGFLFGAIPYAAPPAGALRYVRPQPPPRWEGVRDASACGPALPQPGRTLPGLKSGPMLGAWDGGEPQLTLNVWTPDVGAGAGGLPVLVWLHGGAFVAGAPDQAVYDGRSWMRDGVVLVTVGYRLGVEGFVPFAGGDANVALHDMLAALRWVAQEIESFGGDPARVCVAGQSAGAMALGWLLGSQRSRGLFARAISMSGGVELAYTPAQAELVAAHVAGKLGVQPTAQAMRELPLARVIAAQGAIAPGEIDLAPAGGRDPTGGLIWVAPVHDGDVVADDPLAALAQSAGVALLAGTTLEEGRLYLAGLPGFDEFPAEALAPFAGRLSERPEELLAAVRAANPDAHAGALAAGAITEAAFHGPTARLLERRAELAGASTHAYRFTWRSGALGGRLGAAHAVDLPFAFDTLDAPHIAGSDDALLGVEGGPAELARTLHGALVRFVGGGDPGWARYPHVEVL